MGLMATARQAKPGLFGQAPDGRVDARAAAGRHPTGGGCPGCRGGAGASRSKASNRGQSPDRSGHRVGQRARDIWNCSEPCRRPKNVPLRMAAAMILPTARYRRARIIYEVSMQY